MRIKRRTYRGLRVLSLAIVALALLGIIGAALSGNPGQSSALPKPAPTSPLGRASAPPATARTAARHRRHHHRRRHRAVPAVAAATTPAAAPTPAGCHPISDEGTCYEPGEYCRYDDEGMTGVAGDGETITCEDNDGWRWEPS
jgi:hypothetical protein